ncbi:Lar family restriction alleviation protein [Comamonas aquatica]|uniref:Lar family restriction alleviation protein n=1 Tax=Comamonas aquatica TaxID=225991 RepID=UPI002449550C|nr:Lar family restriction alleviation protein [Comamonas aquatica]MDH0495743.1 hypothetical protein [Comamonas aquatica]
MTHHTEAELLPCPFCGTAAKAVNSYEDDDWRIECWNDECSCHGKRCQNRSDAVFEWNRRAPGSPVPQGWKLAPVTPTKEQLRAGYWSGAGEIRLHEEWARKASYERMLSAAPQPPEAATVQLPEPAGCVVYANGESHHWAANRECAELFASSERSIGAPYAFTFENLYTEQQVRELLAAHGIQERST